MATRPLSILHIVADQHHASWLGSAGHPHVRTPHLDALAAEGVRLTCHCTTNPICTPSRVSFLSGQYCHNHGYYAIEGPAPRGLPSYLHHFKAAGYRTAAFGKTHVPNNPRNWLEDACDELSDTLHGPDGQRATSGYRDYLRRHGLLDRNDHDHIPEQGKRAHHWDARPSTMPLDHCVEAWISGRATDFVRGLGDDQPFAMHLSYPHPHHCLTPDRRFWDLYDGVKPPPSLLADGGHRPPNFQRMVRYCREELEWAFEPRTFEAGAQRAWRATLALVTQNDHFFGRVFDVLRETGRWDDTVVVFHADHGAYHGLFGIEEKAPGICSDAICRVPSVWRVPGLEGGRTANGPVEHVDVAPTFCALAGLPPMETADGADLGPMLRGAADAVKDAAVTEWPWSKSLRWRQWRFVHYHRAMYGGRDVGDLYDIEADPDETRNLYHEPDHQATVHACRRRLLEWLTETTRVRTMWPYLPEDEAAFRNREPFALAADGREPASKGPQARLAAGRIGAFEAVDYL